jgi:hypothetical protein
MQKQDLSKLQVRKVKGFKRKLDTTPETDKAIELKRSKVQKADESD